MARFLKTLALAAGAGVAFGLCTTAGSRRASRRPEHASPERDAIIDIEPLLDRLESLERRLATPAAAAPLAVTELTRRMDALEVRATEIQSEIQAKLEAEMDARCQAIEFKVSERIAALERAVGEQHVSIDALRTRAQDTDANLQRLIVAIEKLCERTAAPAPPAPIVLPFEAHMNEARIREEVPVPEFRARVFREMGPETEPEPAVASANGKKSRFPLTRIFGMLALLALVPFLG